jgi:general stress protein 26
MSTELKDETDAKDRLWTEIQKVRYGMLGLVGSGSGGHFQPMAAFCEPDVGDIWFFTRKDTELARATLGAADAMFTIQSKDQTFQVCIGGKLQQQHDRVRLEHYWNPIVAAWYPGGKDDPELTLLRLAAKDAQVWLSESNPVRFAWEIAKANLKHEFPDVGDSKTVTLGGDRV